MGRPYQRSPRELEAIVRRLRSGAAPMVVPRGHAARLRPWPWLRSRRGFLVDAARWGLVAAATPPLVTACARPAAEPEPVAPDYDRKRFPLSVGAGDPGPRQAVLWTKAQGTGRVRLQVATDAAFAELVVDAWITVDPERNGTVAQLVEGLAPERTYHYRFLSEAGTSSPVGRLRTLPERTETLRFAFVSCQDYTNGFYSAYYHLAQEELDFVVHLGDYIYESVGDPAFQFDQARTILLDNPEYVALTLADYRLLYETYRSDPNLQRVHERFPFFHIWDDHEFANDVAGIHSPDNGITTYGSADQPERRAAANRAFSEYIPGRYVYDPNEPDPIRQIKLYRSFRIGELAKLIILDERLYRSLQPCAGEDRVGGRYATPGCPEQWTTTMLGAAQLAWFLEELEDPSVQWKIVVNEVTINRILLGDLYLNLDQWDGYAGERALILEEIRRRGIRDVVFITGDIHMFFVGAVSPTFAAGDPPVAVEFTTASITSSNLGTALRSFFQDDAPAVHAEAAVLTANPNLRFFDSRAHGYVTVEVTPEAATFELVAVDTIARPDVENTARRVLARWLVPAGRAELVRLG